MYPCTACGVDLKSWASSTGNYDSIIMDVNGERIIEVGSGKHILIPATGLALILQAGM